jgi:hypothetical protein
MKKIILALCGILAFCLLMSVLLNRQSNVVVPITQKPQSFAERNNMKAERERRELFFQQAFGGRKLDANVIERVDDAIRVFSSVTPSEYAALYDVHALWVEYMKTNHQSAFLEDTNIQATLSDLWDKVEAKMGGERYRIFHETLTPEYRIAYEVSGNDERAAIQFSRESKELREAVLNADSQEEFALAQKRAVHRLKQIFGDEVFSSKRLALEQALGAPLGSF